MQHGSPNLAFLEAAKEKGATDEGLLAMLSAAGRSDRQAKADLLELYVRQTGQTPQTGAADRTSNPLDGFLYSGSSLLLVWWVTAALTLIISLVDSLIPDPLVTSRGGAVADAMVFPLATILVCIPLYLFFIGSIRSRLAHGWTHYRSPIRLWCLSVTLLAGLAVGIGYIIWGVYLILSSGMTLAAGIKLGSSLGLLGIVLAGYLAWLRQDPKSGAAS